MSRIALRLPDSFRYVATLGVTLGVGWLLGAVALDADERIRFTSFGVGEGLSNTTVIAALQDRAGFLWLGTGTGLERFDGYAFEAFRHDASNAWSPPPGDIAALLEDRASRLWIGGSGGLSVFDRDSRKCYRTPGDLDVASLFEDRSGALWIGADQGLFRIAPEAMGGQAPWDTRPLAAAESLGLLEFELSDPRVKALAEGRDGELWIGTRGGLYRLSAEQPYLVAHFRHDAGDDTSLHDDEIYELLVDRKGDLWIGTWGGGGLGRVAAGELAAERPRFRSFVYPEGDPRGPASDVVRALYEDSEGNLWVGTQHRGISYLSARERARDEPRFRTLDHDPHDSGSIAFSNVRALAGGRDGGIWVGTGLGGLSHHASATAAVTMLRPEGGGSGASRPQSISAVCESHDGSIWLGSRSGLWRRSASEDMPGPTPFEHFFHDPNDETSLGSDRVFHIEEDRRGRLWIATGEGIDLLEPSSPTGFVHFRPGERGLATRAVMTLYESDSGTIWAGAYRGLYRVVEEASGGLRFASYFHDSKDPSTLSSDLIYALAEDLQGRLWVATKRGLDRMDQDRLKVERQPVAPGMLVYQLARGADGTLWAASPSHGLVRIDPASGSWCAWQRRDGLADDACLAVAIDEGGAVWATTQHHLHRLDPQGGTLKAFDRRDGIESGPHDAWDLRLGPSGRLYLPGIGGVAAFRPEELATEGGFDAPVVLTGLRLADRPVSVGEPGVLPYALDALETLTLPPHERTLSLEFAALVFHRQERIRYAYRLSGSGVEWLSSDARQRRATFLDLSPGRHVFEVRAANADGLWSPREARLEIRVLPHWYETRTLRGALALALIGLPLAWAWRRYRQVERRRQTLQEVVDRLEEERRQRRRWQELSVAASGLAHETKNPLGIIRGLAQRLEGAAELDATSREKVAMILDQADRAADRLGEFLTYARLRDPRFVPCALREVIEKTLDVLDSDLDASGVPVEVEVDATSIEADEEMLVQILVNLILNSLEASEPGSLLTLGFEKRGEEGVLVVEDRGQGIPPELLTEIRKPYVSGTPSGHGLGLAIVERLAQQQDWELHIMSEVGLGTRVELDGIRLAG